MANKITTKEYEKVIESVLIDDRENERVEYGLNQYSPFNPQVAHLEIGDYIFKGVNGIEVVFEYKTANDFLTSIENNHLHNQVYYMITNFDYTFVIVEAENLYQTLDERYYNTGLNMSISQVNGAIAEFSTNSTVLFCQTQYQAFDLMMRVSGKIMLQKPYKYKYGKKSTNGALNYLSSLRGLDNKAEVICRELNLKTKKDLDNLTVERLCEVKGIGGKTAENIIKQLK